MNMVDLQLDFYRRYNDGASRLHISRRGTLCTLLGTTDIYGAASITCALSMGVTVLARRLDSGYIKVESTDTAVCHMYPIAEVFKGANKAEREMRTVFEKTGFKGAEILYDSDTPPGIDIKYPLRSAVLNALVNMLHADNLTLDELSMLCDGTKDLSVYKALMLSKRGWCNFMDKSEARHYPLPMTGLIFITVQGRGKPHYPKSSLLNREFSHLKKIHPSVFTYSDIRNEDIRKDTYTYLPFFAQENERIDEARKALRGCNIEAFAEIVNESSHSFIEYLNPSDEQSFTARVMPHIEGCMCARPSGSLVYAIGEEKMADYVTEKIKGKFEDRFGYEPTIAISAPY